jgi:hypothetical protein
MTVMPDAIEGPHLLHFGSLLRGGRAFLFPCDASGVVDLDALSEHARNQYLYARAMIGREVSAPRVVPPTAPAC